MLVRPRLPRRRRRAATLCRRARLRRSGSPRPRPGTSAPNPETRPLLLPRQRSSGQRPALVELALHRPAAELVAAGELELAQDRAHVGLDGLDADAEAVADLLVHVPAGEMAQDLELARRQLVDLAVGRGRAAGFVPEGVEHEAGEARGED